MTRKDYCLVAASIKKMVEADRTSRSVSPAVVKVATREMVNALCTTFKADNSAFRADMFRSACGMED